MRAVARRWFGIVLWKRILAALVLGAIAGLVVGDASEQIKWVGDLFIRMIKMLIVPLVFVTLVSGVTAMKDPKRLGSIGSLHRRLQPLFVHAHGAAALRREHRAAQPGP